jgi:hypothetical protein
VDHSPAGRNHSLKPNYSQSVWDSLPAPLLDPLRPRIYTHLGNTPSQKRLFVVNPFAAVVAPVSRKE